MADSTNETIKGIITRISAQVSDLGSRVYSDPPQDSTFPYAVVTIGSNPYEAKGITDMEHIVRCQVFARGNGTTKGGRREAVDIRSDIYTALNRQEANITITGFTLVSIMVAPLIDAFKDQSGKTWQGVIEFRTVVQS